MAEQLTLRFAFQPGLGEQDYLIGTFNAAAYDMIDLWPSWPDSVVILSGPEGSGKTHLANIWAKKSRAEIRQLSDLREADVQEMANLPAIVLQHRDTPFEEQALFHLLNLARERQIDILVTARSKPDGWLIRTPDLLSRLRLAPLVQIESPDDASFRALLAKLLHDRQLQVDPNVIEYLMIRSERSFAAATQVVELLDMESLSKARPITRAIAANVLTRMRPLQNNLDLSGMS